MSGWTSVPPMSTSPRCDRSLTPSVASPARLTADERDQMYALLQTYFSGVARGRFEADLQEKETVILLRDARSDSIRGFSTLMRLGAHVGDRDVVAFFSGDTIVDREHWTESVLSRIWGQTVFAEADRIAAERPSTRIFWFLICSGYRTWRFLPVFFREFYPNANTPTPPSVRRILDTLASRKFGDQYLPGPGIVRLRAPTPLRPGVADVSHERLRDPRVAFFVRMNPGHANGDELACLAELSRANLTRAAQRMMLRPGGGHRVGPT